MSIPISGYGNTVLFASSRNFPRHKWHEWHFHALLLRQSPFPHSRSFPKPHGFLASEVRPCEQYSTSEEPWREVRTDANFLPVRNAMPHGRSLYPPLCIASRQYQPVHMYPEIPSLYHRIQPYSCFSAMLFSQAQEVLCCLCRRKRQHGNNQVISVDAYTHHRFF